MSPASLTLSATELKNLEEYIVSAGLNQVPPTNKYESLRISDGDVRIVVYTSGKIVHNGSESSQKIIDEILRPEDTHDFVLGSDETGKGEWYGPLVVTATALTPDQILVLRKLGVRDSKTIRKPELMKLAVQLFVLDFPRFTITLLPERYNLMYADFEREGKSLNDLMAWAHADVIKDALMSVNAKNARVVIDKFDFRKMELRLASLDRTHVEIIQKSHGESEIPVAAASIIAKYTFETEVDKLNERYGIDLRKMQPEDLDPSILPFVAKMHFKNVSGSR